ncbi:uncharacterized protein LOC129770842 isoform X3 [Toxorhynchites rutilus septentrionalis]|uniref:uncharacterized protein LOC129770842 isoform X3 n=1 Tax=Toxorhynchites rutilus septentrionalis TaxID=329112 RepID=UPI002479F3A2|nr:uncharacterized protein LOC129770842 isoform X3 [Toxorhynchites rutilus septentrionalis]
MVDNFECAGYTFYSKFDSGNLGKVELVRCCEGLNIIGSNVSTAANVSLLPSSGGGVLSPTAPHQTALSTGISGTHPSPTVPPTVAAAEQPCLTPPIVPTSAGGSVTVVAPPDLHHHQLLHHHSAAFVEVEYNLWTRPDCAGTPYENQNRTWFYFAVTGGRPNQIVKFNVMNLNKQAKLFSQGMHPVMRVGPAGRWERIRDKPSYSIANDIFFISFLHRAPESAETKTYYAFTFPFTYNELLEQLGNFDKRFGRHPFEWHQIAHEISLKYDASTGAGPVEILPQTVHHGQSQKKGKLAKVAKVERRSPHSFDDTARDGTGTDDATLPKVSDPGGKLLEETEPSSSMSIDDSNTSESMQQITKLVNKVKIELPQSQPTLTDPSKQRLPIYQQVLNVPTLDDDTKATNLDHRDDIYYYRELLTHSVEKRRVELLTITSFHGIQTTREDRLQNLFPDEKTPRCHTFKHKKIIFISSRVHPGETPASFVLNGFLSMLLDRRSIVSITLRRMYVFKIVPFLNPDGVYNGLYRSDTRGHNLNRVYLTPNYETQPSIYAARKLIRYYHLGTDEPEPYELEMDKKPPLSKSPDTSSEENAVEETPSATAEVSSAIKKCPSTKKAQSSTKRQNSVETRKNRTLPYHKGLQQMCSPANNESNTTWSTTLLNKIFRRRKPAESSGYRLRSIACRGTSVCLTPVVEESADLVPLSADTNRSALLLLSKTSSLIVEISNSMEKSFVDDSESTEENTPSTSDSGFGEQSLSKCSTISASSSTVTLVETEISTPSLQTLADTSNAMTDTTGEPLLASNTDSSTITVTDEVLPPPKVFTEQLIPDLLPVVTESGLALRHVRSASNLSTGSSMVTNASTIVHVNTKKAPLVTAKVNTGRKSSSSFKNVMNKPHLIATTPNTLKMKDFGIPQQQQPQQSQQMQSQLNQSSLGKGGSIGGKKSSALHHKRGESKIRPQTPQMYSHFRSHRNEYLNPASQKNINISLDYLAQLDEKNDKVIYEEKSNMFLYIDLHGHASKKGVFMYGNHLPSTIEAVECMLLPRLMSLNSQHFHYDACNFSERNMYYKGKRDGLSKEGSGRVAIYKCTGLIKSYTLECNYNTGKSVNILPLRGKELATAKVQSPVPPKYTPAVFEEVGRALGPSILDLTNSNPQSRLQNSDFRTLQGLRNMLRIEVERGSSKARITNKYGDIVSYEWLEIKLCR